jgi:hypothetical protein
MAEKAARDPATLKLRTSTACPAPFDISTAGCSKRVLTKALGFCRSLVLIFVGGRINRPQEYDPRGRSAV